LEEAAEQFRQALETDPLSMVVHFMLSYSLYAARQYDSAIECAARALDINASFWLMHLATGIAQFQKGSIQEAIASLEKTLALSPSFSPVVGYLAAAYVQAGNRGHAAKLIPEFKERNPGGYCSPLCLAFYHASLGEADPMFGSLHAALVDRDSLLTRI